MTSNFMEAIIGAVVLLVAAGFLVFAYKTTDLRSTGGYDLYARFDRIDGLTIGSDVRLSGIKVGRVGNQHLDTETFEAVVQLSINKEVRLPEDSSVTVATEGLLGGTYIDIQPGGAPDHLAAGDTIQFTEGATDIMALVKRAVFSTGEEGGTP